MRTVKRLAMLGVAAAIATASLSLSTSSASADNPSNAEQDPAPKPTVVLVHGAFAESASWNGVIARLQQQGYPVVAAANPLRGLKSDTEYLKKVLAGIDGPVVLAGHSYGGLIISDAATGNPRIKALAYIAAFAPEAGETALGLSGKFPGSTLGETLVSVPLGDGTSDLSVRQDKFHEQFAADLSPQDAALAAATQRPVRDVALNEAAGDPAWHTIPSWFAIPTRDKNIPAQAQHFMAERANAREVLEIPGASHLVAVSQPEQIADLIIRAAGAAG